MNFSFFACIFLCSEAVSISKKTAPGDLLDDYKDLAGRKITAADGVDNAIPGIVGGKQWNFAKGQRKIANSWSFSGSNIAKRQDFKTSGKDHKKDRSELLVQSGKVSDTLDAGKRQDKKSTFIRVQNYGKDEKDLNEGRLSPFTGKSAGGNVEQKAQLYSIGSSSEGNLGNGLVGSGAASSDMNLNGNYSSWINNKGRHQTHNTWSKLVGTASGNKQYKRDDALNTLDATVNTLAEDDGQFTAKLGTVKTNRFGNPEQMRLAKAGPGSAGRNEAAAQTGGQADGHATAGNAINNAGNYDNLGRSIQDVAWHKKSGAVDGAKWDYQTPMTSDEWVKYKYGNEACKDGVWAGTDGCHVYCNLNGVDTVAYGEAKDADRKSCTAVNGVVSGDRATGLTCGIVESGPDAGATGAVDLWNC